MRPVASVEVVPGETVISAPAETDGVRSMVIKSAITNRLLTNRLSKVTALAIGFIVFWSDWVIMDGDGDGS